MASEVDICNLSLGHLGDEANVQTIAPPDGTSQARHCARFYPIARDATLELHAWSFATERETLAQLTTPTSTAWEYQYQKPAEMLKPLAIYPADTNAISGFGDDDNKHPFIVEGDRILTNTPDAVLRYTKKITDPNLFTPLFTTTFSYMLASFLAGPIIKGSTGTKVAQAMRQSAERELASAAASDANSSNYKPVAQADWHSARGIATRSARRSSTWRA